MGFTNYLSWTLFVVLLIWGPYESSWKAGLAIRLGYLLIVPIMVQLILIWFWNKWKPSWKLEFLLNRILSIVICITLISIALLEATSKTHIGNTEGIVTRDGIELVGDSIALDGPNWGNVVVILILAAIFLWLGVKKREDKNDNSQ